MLRLNQENVDNSEFTIFNKIHDLIKRKYKIEFICISLDKNTKWLSEI